MPRNRRRRGQKNGAQEDPVPASLSEAIQHEQPEQKKRRRRRKKNNTPVVIMAEPTAAEDENKTTEQPLVYPTYDVPKGTPAVSSLKRLMRDLAELQRAEILTVSACPLEDNIYEWHVNIKAPDGVYAGSYLHCVMEFPQNYPSEPPRVELLTPIAHPNLFDDGYICMTMLTRSGLHSDFQFEGWSSGYTVTSILLQLQSFFFADNIKQEYGYSVDMNASSYYRTNASVKEGIERCKNFKCSTCGHCSEKPYPPLAIDRKQQMIKMTGTTDGVSIDGTNIQTMVQKWVGAWAEQGFRGGRLLYEVLVQWTGDEWREDNITGGLCRFGWGTRTSSKCGLRGDASVGYGGTAKFSYDGVFEEFGETFAKGDVVTCAVDFKKGLFLFGKNGRLMGSAKRIPEEMRKQELYPIASFKNARAEFNFGPPNRAVRELKDYTPLGCVIEKVVSGRDKLKHDSFDGWVNLPDDLAFVILRFLDSVSLRCASWTMRRWEYVFEKYNLAARHEFCCFHTKIPYSRCILGVGLSKTNGVYSMQAGYISNFAWRSGVRQSAWGSRMDVFLALILTPKHSKRSLPMILKTLERINDKSHAFALAKIMNDLVVHLAKAATAVTGRVSEQKNDRYAMYTSHRTAVAMEMQMCETALVGYASFHHILLYLLENNESVRRTAEELAQKLMNGRLDKFSVGDLGQALVLVSSLGKPWKEFAKKFIEEVWTRNVLWFTRKDDRFNRPKESNYKEIFNATAVSRGVVMFQIMFAQLVASGESPAVQLQAYYDRLGRPEPKSILRLHSFCKKFVSMVQNGSFEENYDFYWKTLGFMSLEKDNFIDFLRFSVWRSNDKMYHTPYGRVKVDRRVRRLDPRWLRLEGEQEDNENVEGGDHDEQVTDEQEGGQSDHVEQEQAIVAPTPKKKGKKRKKKNRQKKGKRSQ